ncbi:MULTISPECIES: hypothetical protein [unclassified Ruegeria]|uniref:hypothetical protein n=1 Tax=unclassified Ruegeria TaxID=2625375 RepID=UPI0014879660|nr:MULTISPECIES: hypothetical protein [unclassified Ruegeria]
MNYDDIAAGEIKGSLTLLWVDETQRGSGDGTFVFVPNKDPLRMERHDPRATVPEIRPQIMYTDGGSIPKAAQALKGFSPWGYAPAYMLHDWLFVARKCLNDNDATAEEQKMESVTFKESVRIAVEAIKGLEDKGTVTANPIAPRVIAAAISSGISYRLWNEKGACKKNRIKPKHLGQIDKALPGLIDRKLLPADRFDKSTQPAKIITTFSFD